MGRSANYHSDAYKVLYTNVSSDFEWNCLYDDIISSLQEIAPSLDKPSKKEWHDNEVSKMLENKLVSVWLSEYCGLVSISFVTQDWVVSLAENWLDQMLPKFQAILNPSLEKVGTFSNGEDVYEKVS